MTLEFHPLANIFPLIEGAEFDALVADVKENGVQQPIILFEGKILDGRNRYRAATQAGVEFDTTEYFEADPLAYVVSLNLHRRHLDEGQRATVAGKLETLKHGERADRHANLHLSPVKRSQAAEMLNVSSRSVASARSVIDAVDAEEAIPEILHAMEQGRLAPSMAEKIVKADPEIQKKIIARVNEGTKPTEAARQVIAAVKSERRVANPTGKYRVIYADPPWSYGNTMPDEFGEQRDHYPVMSLQEICAMPVKEWAEDDAVLFLWVTSPILEESFQVINSWGFKYKASFIWDKVKHVMGHYNSVRHEILLVCVKGSCQPDERKLFDSVVSIERTAHSRKPDYFYEIIETLYTHGEKLELFRRGEAREGWKAYGNEVADAA